MRNLKKVMILAGLTLTVALGAYGTAVAVNASATNAVACSTAYCDS